MKLPNVVTDLINALTVPRHQCKLWSGNILDPSVNYSRQDFHVGPEGGSATWSNADTEDNYRSNVAGLNLTDYDENSFQYVHNAHGYRCDSFDGLKEPKGRDEYRIAFIGCSMTYGVGVPVDHAWPYQIISRLRNDFPDTHFPYINLAKGGRSIDYIVRILYLFARSVDFDMAVVMMPMPTRAELVFDPERIMDYMHDTEMGLMKPLEQEALQEYREHFAGNDLYIQYQLQKNFAFLQTLARAHGFHLAWSSWVDEGMLLNWLSPDLRKGYLGKRFHGDSVTGKFARDGIHPEEATHARFANRVYDKLAEQVRVTVSPHL